MKTANKQKLYLISARDFLFEEYLGVVTMYENWIIKSKDTTRTQKERAYSADVVNLMKEHIKMLNENLVELDTRITELKTTSDIYTQLAELN